MRICTPCGVLVGAVCAAAVGCGEVDQVGQAEVEAPRAIPSVASLGALRRLEPMRLEGGWEVRLGLAGPGQVDGPWRILYCLAKHVGPGEPPGLHPKTVLRGKMLGPVVYRFRKVGVECRDVAGVGLEPAGPRGEVLYAAGIALAWPGRSHVEVLGPAGRLLARTTLNVAKPAPCYWQLFAEPADENAWTFAVRRGSVAAMPHFRGRMPLRTWSGRRQELVDDRDALPTDLVWPRGAEGNTLRAREAGQHPLELSLEKGAFVIRSGVKMNDDVELHFLARWWVNGKPAPASRVGVVPSIERGRMARHVNELRVGFALPAGVKQLQAGDRVGLQVAYCPIGWDVPAEAPGEPLATSLLTPGDPIVPLLSNRLDFKVTPEMLEQAGRGTRDGP